MALKTTTRKLIKGLKRDSLPKNNKRWVVNPAYTHNQARKMRAENIRKSNLHHKK